jgi:uncharacterized protein
MFTSAERRQLVDVARRAVTARVLGYRPDPPEPGVFPHASGVFVTLKIDGALRGCLGTIERVGNLVADVARCAADAAREDPRFSGLGSHELDRLTVDISVLGPLERIDPRDVSAVSIGLHGLVVEADRRRGLLLPQVATEWGWTREQFLRQTCLKAGLAGDAWEKDAAVYRFTAEVFGD